MAMDLAAAEILIATAIKDGLLLIYASDSPDPDEMQKVGDAVAPGMVEALQHILDTAETSVDAEDIL